MSYERSSYSICNAITKEAFVNCSFYFMLPSLSSIALMYKIRPVQLHFGGITWTSTLAAGQRRHCKLQFICCWPYHRRASNKTHPVQLHFGGITWTIQPVAAAFWSWMKNCRLYWQTNSLIVLKSFPVYKAYHRQQRIIRFLCSSEWGGVKIIIIMCWNKQL
jgi:hypothetical protein